MLLVIDVGNTNTVLGAMEGEKVAHSWRVSTVLRVMIPAVVTAPKFLSAYL